MRDCVPSACRSPGTSHLKIGAPGRQSCWLRPDERGEAFAAGGEFRVGGLGQAADPLWPRGLARTKAHRPGAKQIKGVSPLLSPLQAGPEDRCRSRLATWSRSHAEQVAPLNGPCFTGRVLAAAPTGRAEAAPATLAASGVPSMPLRKVAHRPTHSLGRRQCYQSPFLPPLGRCLIIRGGGPVGGLLDPDQNLLS